MSSRSCRALNTLGLQLSKENTALWGFVISTDLKSDPGVSRFPKFTSDHRAYKGNEIYFSDSKGRVLVMIIRVCN